MALGFSANCLTYSSSESDWISTGSWKSDKIPVPCNNLQQLDLLNITLMQLQTNTSSVNINKVLSAIIWNDYLGNEWHFTEVHPGMRHVTEMFFKEVFQIDLSNFSTTTQRKEWMFYGLSLPCCSHFALRKSAFKTLAKLHALFLVYMIIHYGEPYLCPWSKGYPVGERCWGFLNERLTSVYLRIITDHLDITNQTQCDLYNTTIGKQYKASTGYRFIFGNVTSLFTSKGINLLYNYMKYELFSINI
jgi:hypothetical protein